MRRIATCLIAALVVVSVACDGGDSKKYPDEVRKNFLDTCTTSGANEKQCRCALEKLEGKFSLQQFQDLEKRITAGDASAEAEIAPLVTQCRNA
jgi:hypothetical protein